MAGDSNIAPVSTVTPRAADWSNRLNRIANLKTFHIPPVVVGNAADIKLGKSMVLEWQTEGMFQVACTPDVYTSSQLAFEASREFFARPTSEKLSYVSDLTFAGYIASGEELTAGEADSSEIFTLVKDLPLTDKRVQDGWPGHGPVPWPSSTFKEALQKYLRELGSIGDRLLQLISLGLGLQNLNALKSIANDGWHHARVLRYPPTSSQSSRGTGSHTDYGFLVIITQDDAGGLSIRPPINGEIRNRNWLPSESSAGMYEDSEEWNYVKPVRSTLVVFPGDMFQLLPHTTLLSTPHKVHLTQKERYSLAYFHEPNFQQIIKPFNNADSMDFVHYGEVSSE
ncbi:unnamed protein product [Adineta ricciae]|uniref:Fe2OG dioxygenase domain-containing protein n=1 Tax=Adineta ricciae TaxID=249248 RepID=A0A815K916_ADIRI|nr:unnamed protein product [Adineta ricciae]